MLGEGHGKTCLGKPFGGFQFILKAANYLIVGPTPAKSLAIGFQSLFISTGEMTQSGKLFP